GFRAIEGILATGGVDGEDLHFVASAQLGVVLLLESGDADDVTRGDLAVGSAVASPARPSSSRAKVRVGARSASPLTTRAPGRSSNPSSIHASASSGRTLIASTNASGPAASTRAVNDSGSTPADSATCSAADSRSSSPIFVLSSP